jgi:proteasome lid subunit RPN8/RPN11
LTIAASVLDEVHAHCRDAYPQECCGAIVGRIVDIGKSADRIVRLENAEPDAPERRFVIDPRRLMELGRAVSAEHLDVIGFYHSHPDSPARPSATDLEWAWPVYSYVIVSVADGEIADTRSYELDDAASVKQFIEEDIQISTR